MKRWLKKLSAILLILIAVFAISGGLYLQHPKFGKLPKDEYLAQMKKSPHYVDGRFANLVPTPQFSKDTSIFSATLGFLTNKKVRPAPSEPVPAVKTDLRALPLEKDIIIWLGHSSYYIQLAGKRLLVDPVLSDYAAPLPFLNRAFAGTNIYSTEDIPEIDYLLITHDHWDHLDYPTVTGLKSKIKNIICPLGVGGYLEQWGFSRDNIYEGDWFDKFEFADNFTVTVLPARHFSGRLLERNKTLWAAYAVTVPHYKIFMSGDSGYSEHFKNIGELFGGFDIAIMENGQYDPKWPYIHMSPEESSQATIDLKAQKLLPAHSGKFSISNHPWDEPFQRISKSSQGAPYRLLTPMIGEAVDLADKEQTFSQWWKNID